MIYSQLYGDLQRIYRGSTGECETMVSSLSRLLLPYILLWSDDQMDHYSSQQLWSSHFFHFSMFIHFDNNYIVIRPWRYENDPSDHLINIANRCILMVCDPIYFSWTRLCMCWIDRLTDTQRQRTDLSVMSASRSVHDASAASLHHVSAPTADGQVCTQSWRESS